MFQDHSNQIHIWVSRDKAEKNPRLVTS